MNLTLTATLQVHPAGEAGSLASSTMDTNGVLVAWEDRTVL